MKYDDLESLIEKCLVEIEKASEGFYQNEEADKTAAIILKTQIKLSYYMEEIEFKSRTSKSDISRIEGEKYHEFKNNSASKLTDAALSALIAKDSEVCIAKQKYAMDESALKKWIYLSNVLTNSHLYFRAFSKRAPI